MVDCASTLPRFVFIGVDGRSVAAEEEFYRWKSFGRRIAKKSNVDFSSRDVLLYKYGLPEFLEDDFSGFAQLVGGCGPHGDQMRQLRFSVLRSVGTEACLSACREYQARRNPALGGCVAARSSS